MTPSAAKRASSAPLRMRTASPDRVLDRRRELRPVAGPADRLGARSRRCALTPIASAIARKRRDGLDRAAETVRGDRAGLGEPLAEAAEGLLVEARQRRAAELVIDDEAHRIRADVDDRIGRRGRGAWRAPDRARAGASVHAALRRGPWPWGFPPRRSWARRADLARAGRKRPIAGRGTNLARS